MPETIEARARNEQHFAYQQISARSGPDDLRIEILLVEIPIPTRLPNWVRYERHEPSRLSRDRYGRVDGAHPDGQSTACESDLAIPHNRGQIGHVRIERYPGVGKFLRQGRRCLDVHGVAGGPIARSFAEIVRRVERVGSGIHGRARSPVDDRSRARRRASETPESRVRDYRIVDREALQSSDKPGAAPFEFISGPRLALD